MSKKAQPLQAKVPSIDAVVNTVPEEQKEIKPVQKKAPAKKKAGSPSKKKAPAKPANKKASASAPKKKGPSKPANKPAPKKDTKKIAVNTNNILAIHSVLKAPRSFVYKHEEATAQIQKARKCDTLEADVKMLRQIDGEDKGKPYPEIQAFVTIANKWKSFVDKVALDIKLRGMNLISIHKLDEVRNTVQELRSEIKTAAEACVKQLPIWKQNAIKSNAYIEEKFPTAEYFKAYDLHVRYFPFSSDNVSLPENSEMEMEVAREAIGKLADAVSATFKSLNDYISGKAKKFTENSLENLYVQATNLRESGFIQSEQFDAILDTASKVATSTNAVAIREAIAKIEKGVVTVDNTVKKRGRKATPVTKEEIDECREYVNDSVKPFEKVMAEIEDLAKGLV